MIGLIALSGCESSGEMSIVDVEPREAPAAGGHRIAIKGNNFRTDIGYTVYFGSERSPAVTIIDPETLVVEVPPHDAASGVDITVSADNGDAFRIASAFSFKGAASPTEAPTGNLKY
ncbi:MAG: IPT/TIG domain-containing protein [Myxococcales bacterium]|nr:IPT/TIG domain-containing protein [Myxococcales bacterium]